MNIGNQFDEARKVLEDAYSEELSFRWASGDENAERHEEAVAFFVARALRMCRKQGHCIAYNEDGVMKGVALVLPPRIMGQVRPML